MRFKVTITIFIVITSLLGWSCSKQTVEPNLTGSIKGQVQQNNTGEAVSDVSITTNPGTDAILTDTAGAFNIDNIPTGSYTVQAEKDGYTSKIVRVTVKEDQAARATIILKKDDDEPTNKFIKAEVTNFFNTTRNDSSFAEIDYLVKNTSENKGVPNFSVTFKIYTSERIFYTQIKGDSLDSGQQAVGDTVKYIRETTADSVVVSNVYAPSS